MKNRSKLLPILLFNNLNANLKLTEEQVNINCVDQLDIQLREMKYKADVRILLLLFMSFASRGDSLNLIFRLRSYGWLIKYWVLRKSAKSLMIATTEFKLTVGRVTNICRHPEISQASICKRQLGKIKYWL